LQDRIEEERYPSCRIGTPGTSSAWRRSGGNAARGSRLSIERRSGEPQDFSEQRSAMPRPADPNRRRTPGARRWISGVSKGSCGFGISLVQPLDLDGAQAPGTATDDSSRRTPYEPHYASGASGVLQSPPRRRGPLRGSREEAGTASMTSIRRSRSGAMSGDRLGRLSDLNRAHGGRGLPTITGSWCATGRRRFSSRPASSRSFNAPSGSASSTVGPEPFASRDGEVLPAQERPRHQLIDITGGGSCGSTTFQLPGLEGVFIRVVGVTSARSCTRGWGRAPMAGRVIGRRSRWAEVSTWRGPRGQLGLLRPMGPTSPVDLARIVDRPLLSRERRDRRRARRGDGGRGPWKR